jgi:hypothetical protein
MTKNNKNSFAVRLNNPGSRTDAFYKERLLAEARKNGLSIAGEDRPYVTHGVDYATSGNLITVGTADNHDVEWVRRPEYLCERGVKPIYDIVEDWNTIVSSMRTYAEEKYGMRLGNGKKVTFHKDFVKIGTDIITNYEIGYIALNLR